MWELVESDLFRIGKIEVHNPETRLGGDPQPCPVCGKAIERGDQVYHVNESGKGWTTLHYLCCDEKAVS